jgi:hypothetical protein
MTTAERRRRCKSRSDLRWTQPPKVAGSGATYAVKIELPVVMVAPTVQNTRSFEGDTRTNGSESWTSESNSRLSDFNSRTIDSDPMYK